MTKYRAKKCNNTWLVKCNIKLAKSDNIGPVILSNKSRYLVSKIRYKTTKIIIQSQEKQYYRASKK